jgi:hypothetical protein
MVGWRECTDLAGDRVDAVVPGDADLALARGDEELQSAVVLGTLLLLAGAEQVTPCQLDDGRGGEAHCNGDRDRLR